MKILLIVLIYIVSHIFLSAIEIVVTLNNMNGEFHEAVKLNFHCDKLDNQVALFCASKYLDSNSCVSVRDYVYSQLPSNILKEYKAGQEKKRTRMPVRSFDIFDTILARQVFDPTEIFVLVEKRFPFPNFFSLRQLVRCNNLSIIGFI